MDFVANFQLNKNDLEANFELNPPVQFDALFEINPAGTSWGSITGTLSNQEDLQNALDLKADKSEVEEDITTLDNKIDDVQSDLSGDISALTQTVENNNTAINNRVDRVVDSFDADIEEININISTLNTNLTAEISNRATADSGLQTQLNSVKQTADSAIQPNDNITLLNNNAGYITSADLPTVNNSTITIQSNNVTVGDFNLNQANNETINIAVPTKTSDITNDSGYITNADLPTLDDLTTTEQLNAINSGATTSKIGQIATNTSNILSLSTTVTNNYNTLDGRIKSEVSALNTAIGVETTNRQNADNALQSQIDAIVSSSDVFDIVGTYAELQAYDISTVPVNDIIKVLVDSTHNNAATYYRCTETGGVKSWTYIGAEGAYYTKSEADNKFVEQTTTINNKPLSSNITLTASDVGALPSSTVIGSGVLTIQKNGSNVDTFSANAMSNKSINITVPTKTSDITNDSNFATVSQIPTNNNQLTNGAGYITGINSTDVITALGYTPYDSSNPSGYTSNVGTVTSVNNVSPVNGDVSLTIPTVNDGTITINQGNTQKGIFTVNQSGNTTINLDGNQRNIGEIVASTIPLTDAGLHLLDGALISGSGSYVDFVDYIADLYNDNPTASYFMQPGYTYNYTTTGTITNTDGVLSGFGLSNYISTGSTFTATSSPWEINLKIKTGSPLTGTRDSDFYNGGYDSSNRNIIISLLSTTGVFQVDLSSGGSTLGDVAILTGTYVAQTNTDYWLRVSWDGAVYKLEYSLDGETYITDATANSTAAIGTYTPYIGTYVGSTNDYSFTGTVDLRGCNIKSNGTIWWEGATEVSPEDNWQAYVATYGVCGKFVYDSVNNTVRLPKYNNKIFTGEGTAPVIGNGCAMALTTNSSTDPVTPYGTHYFFEYSGYLSGNEPNVSADAEPLPAGSSNSGSGGFANNALIGLSPVPKISGVIVDLSGITTSVDGYYYIVVATSTKTDIQVDIDEIFTDLNQKVDKSSCATIRCVVEEYSNGAAWYRVYDDGWCEQGGYKSTGWSSNSVSVSFLKNFIDVNYTFVATTKNTAYCYSVNAISAYSTSGVTVTQAQGNNGTTQPFNWVAYGYIH